MLFPYAVELLFAGHNCAISRHFVESVLKIMEHEDNWSFIALRLLNQHDYELKIVGKKQSVQRYKMHFRGMSKSVADCR